jgi:hypothetical protein
MYLTSNVSFIGRPVLIGLVLLAMSASFASSQPSGIPSVISEQEGPYSGTWTWNGSSYDATWSNGAVAILQVKSFTTQSVVIDRTDTPQSTSAGLTAIYTGQISKQGNSIINGSVTWTWPGVPGYPATGTWTASWKVSTTPTADVYKVNYFSNNAAPAPDATVRIDNPGLTYGTLCAMIYVFDADQQLSECCGCPETHNGLRTLSVRSNLTSNPLTGVVSKNGVIKIVSTAFNGACDPTSSFSPTANLRAWVTHIGNPLGSAYPVTETESSDSTLGTTESSNLQAQCAFVQILGSGQGTCSCGTGD